MFSNWFNEANQRERKKKKKAGKKREFIRDNLVTQNFLREQGDEGWGILCIPIPPLLSLSLSHFPA